MLLRLAALALLLPLTLPLAARAQDTPAKQPDTVVPRERDVPRHKQINERAKKGDVDLLFIGDSITQGWEGAGKDVWKKRYESRKAMNAGIGGDVTQHILWRLDNGNVDGISPKLAVLMIGTNNSGSSSAEDIAAGIKAIVEKLRTKLPETKILLLGIFPRAEKPDDPRRMKIAAINEIIQKLDDKKSVYYLDFGDKLTNADGTLSKDIMPDFLHLSPRGYEIWGDAIESKVAFLLGEKPTSDFPKLPAGAGKIDDDASRDFTETDSGLKYRVLRKGKGAAPKGTSNVTVHYEGWLDGGKVFDSSYKRGEKISFPLSGVIKGWTEGLQLVSPGGMIELEIPSKLGYGERGAGGAIPPNATLHFLVELFEVQ